MAHASPRPLPVELFEVRRDECEAVLHQVAKVRCRRTPRAHSGVSRCSPTDLSADTGHPTRLDGTPEGGPRSRAFRAFHLAHISAAAAKVLAFELQHGSSVLDAKLSLA